MRDGLGRISKSLALGFATTLLESKKYNHRSQLASALEKHFLERFFGSNTSIVAYAKELIVDGDREAARKLNGLVNVLGSDVDAHLLIQNVEQNVRTKTKKRRTFVEESNDLAKRVREAGDFVDAIRLAKMLGYTVEEDYCGFLGHRREIVVESAKLRSTRFRTQLEFVLWVKSELCS